MSRKTVEFTVLIVFMSIIGVLVIQSLVHAGFRRGGDGIWYSIEQVCTNGIVFKLALEESGTTKIKATKLFDVSAEVWKESKTFTPTLISPPIAIDGTTLEFSGLYTEWWSSSLSPTLHLNPGERVKLFGDTGSDITFDEAYVTVEDCTVPPETNPATEAYVASLPKTDLYSVIETIDIPPSATCDPISVTLPITKELNIADINVAMYVATDRNNQPFNSKATLTSPEGTKVVLFDPLTGTTGQFSSRAIGTYCSKVNNELNSIQDEKADFILDDDSVFSLTDANVMDPFNETAFKPLEPLSQFVGENAQGDWTLDICDIEPNSNLRCWYLEIEEGTYTVYLPLVIK